MIIELRGVNAKNKGAELMLHAMHQVLTKRIPEAELVLGYGPGNLRLAKEFGVRTQLMLRKKWIDLFFPKIFFLFGVMARKGYYHESEVDVVLDASGFAYGDQWSLGAIQNLNRMLNRLKSRGGRYLLLPQALGPFEREGYSAAFKQAMDKMDFICARDSVSYAAISKIDGSKKLFKYPDFTNLVNVEKVSGLQDKVCIIPNYRMVDKTSEGSGYVKFLCSVVEYLISQKKSFFFLVHDMGKDMDIIGEIQLKFGKQFDVVDNLSALQVKSYISSSKLVISSRFHGVVSALSTGVPCITTSWSHKYEELMGSYGAGSLLVSDFDNVSVGKYFELAENLREVIAEKSKINKKESLMMWDVVIPIITA